MSAGEVAMATDDRDCVRLCLDSHPDAYRCLVERYQATLVAHLTGRLGNRDQAEDAAQETFVRAFFSLQKLEKPESFFPWLLGIARRVAQEFRRDERRHRGPRRPVYEAAPAVDAGEDRELVRAVAELPDSYREIVLLRFYAGQTCTQVAERLSLPVGTVTKKLSRAYVMLRETLQRYERPEEGPEVKS